MLVLFFLLCGVTLIGGAAKKPRYLRFNAGDPRAKSTNPLVRESAPNKAPPMVQYLAARYSYLLPGHVSRPPSISPHRHDLDQSIVS